MRIVIREVQAQLTNENNQLAAALSNCADVLKCMREFTEENNLQGTAYSGSKEYFGSIEIPLTQAMACMYEEKINANNRYSGALNSYFGGMSKIDQEELSRHQSQFREYRRVLEGAVFLETSFSGYIDLLRGLESELEKEIQKVDDFNSEMQGCYDEFNAKLAIVREGIGSAEAANYNSVSKSYKNLSVLNLAWVSKASVNYNIDYETLARNRYGDYLERHSEDLNKVITILKFERFYSRDAEKVNAFLEPLEEQDIIGIKSIAYEAQEPYRGLWIKYLDRFEIKQTDFSGTSFFRESSDGIYLNMERERNDERGAYYIFFHESGHAIDCYCKRNHGDGWFSDNYKDGNNETLMDNIFQDVRNELSNGIENIYNEDSFSDWTREEKSEVKDELLTYLTSGSSSSLSERALSVRKKLRNKYQKVFEGPQNNVSSDIYSGVTNFKIEGDYGHSKKYWWNKMGTEMINQPNKECFAEYYSYNMIRDEDAIDSIKKYLPDSYRCMDGIIEEMTE